MYHRQRYEKVCRGDEMIQIKIKVKEAFSLDGGTIEEQSDRVIIHPPAVLMIDQLITYLDTQPDQQREFKIEH